MLAVPYGTVRLLRTTRSTKYSIRSITLNEDPPVIRRSPINVYCIRTCRYRIVVVTYNPVADEAKVIHHGEQAQAPSFLYEA
jgi:hypothetical protein